ncbi:MAG: hypothetical protein J5993_02300 [Clostridia bacterium]|nr:hypothetical protein [Clostridia bacterium]
MENTNETVESTINLIDVFNALLRRWWIILLTAIICAGALFGYTYATSEQYYEAEVTVYVNSKSDSNQGSITSSDVTLNRKLVATYIVIAKSKTTVTQMVDAAFIHNMDGTEITLVDKYAAMGIDAHALYKFESLKGKMTVAGVGETEILSVKIRCTDPDDALALANAFVNVFPDVISKIIIGTGSTPVEYASTVVAISRGYVKKALIGFAVGFVLAAVFVVIFDVLVNDTIESSEWIQDRFGESIPLLTVIPDEQDSNGKYGYYRYGATKGDKANG